MKWTPWHMWLYWILIRIIWLGSKLVTWDLLFWDFWWVFVMVSRYHHSALRGIYERNEPFFLLFQVFQELVAPPLRCNHDNMMCRGTKYHPLTMTKLLFSMDLLFFWCLAPFVGFPFGMIEGAISPTSCLGHFNTCDPFSLFGPLSHYSFIPINSFAHFSLHSYKNPELIWWIGKKNLIQFVRRFYTKWDTSLLNANGTIGLWTCEWIHENYSVKMMMNVQYALFPVPNKAFMGFS